MIDNILADLNLRNTKFPKFWMSQQIVDISLCKTDIEGVESQILVLGLLRVALYL